MEAKEASWGTAEVGSFDHVVPRVTPGERQQREHRVGEGTPRELALVPPLRLAFGAAKRLQVELVVTLTLTLTPTPALTPALTPTPTPTPTLTPNPHTNPNGGTCLPKPLRTLYLRAGGAGLELGGLELAVF